LSLNRFKLLFLFNFALENAIRKFQENHEGLKLKETCQLLVYADEVYLLVDNIDSIKKNTEIVIDANKEIGLKVNADKAKYTHIFLPRHQNAGQNYDIKIASRSFENVDQFKFFWNDSNKSKFD
jgi:hypothetical protein